MLPIMLMVVLSAPAQQCTVRHSSVAPAYLPEGHFCSEILDEGAMCYTLTEFKLLQLIDRNLSAELAKSAHKDDIIHNYKMMVAQHEATERQLEAERDVYKKRSVRLHSQWEECLSEQTSGGWSTVLIGATVALFAGALVGVLMGATVVSRTDPEK